MILEKLYEARRKEKEEHKREPGVYWVTDLVRCPLKRIYEERYPELTAGDIYSPSSILGSLVHWGLESFLQEQLGAAVEVEEERKIGEIRIKGRIDAVICTGSSRVGVEIKTAMSDVNLPMEHHMLQCKIYNWLFNLDKTILVYITPDRTCEYIVEEKLRDEEVSALAVEDKAPRWPWECMYCPYKVICPEKKRHTRK